MSPLTLEQEKEKIEFEKKLEKNNIYREKLILGLILLLFGAWGTYLIEDFKIGQAKEQFLINKRLEAITEIRDSYIEISIAVAKQKGLLKNILSSSQKPSISSPVEPNSESDLEKKKQIHKDAITKLRNGYMCCIRDFKQKELRHGALISEDFRDHILYQSSIHTAVYYTDFFTLLDYSNFLLDMAEHFDCHCRKEAGVILSIPKGAYFCKPWSDDLLEEKGYEQFLIEEFKNWNKWKKIHPNINEKPPFYPELKEILVTSGP